MSKSQYAISTQQRFKSRRQTFNLTNVVNLISIAIVAPCPPDAKGACIVKVSLHDDSDNHAPDIQAIVQSASSDGSSPIVMK